MTTSRTMPRSAVVALVLAAVLAVADVGAVVALRHRNREHRAERCATTMPRGEWRRERRCVAADQPPPNAIPNMPNGRGMPNEPMDPGTWGMPEGRRPRGGPFGSTPTRPSTSTTPSTTTTTTPPSTTAPAGQ